RDRLTVLPDGVEPVLLVAEPPLGHAWQRPGGGWGAGGARRLGGGAGGPRGSAWQGPGAAWLEGGHRRLGDEPWALRVGLAPHLALVADEDRSRLRHGALRLEVFGPLGK